LPGAALAGLALFAALQALPLSRGVLAWIAPNTAALRADLLPATPEDLSGATGPAVALPAATLSIDPDLTIQTAARLTAAWLLFQCVLGIADDKRVFLRLARAVVLNSVLLALFAITQSLTWTGQIYWSRPVMASSAWSVGGPFLSHNHLAAYLNLGFGLALGLLLRGGNRHKRTNDARRVLTICAAMIIAVCVVTSHSRSGFLALVIASLIFAISLRGRLVRIALSLSVALLIACFFLTLLSSSSSFTTRLSTILDPADQGYQARIGVWKGAISAWWQRPFWGAGMGTFPVAIAPHLTQELTVFFARAENEYVDLLVEGGAVGVALLLLFVAGIALAARRGLAGEREPALVAGASFGLIALLIQSCADFGAHIPAVGVTALVLCGLIARSARDAATRPAAISLTWATRALTRPTEKLRALTTRLSPRVALPGRIFTELPWLGSVSLSAALLTHGCRDAWVEDRLARAGLPLPGTLMPTVGTLESTTLGLDDWRDALEAAVSRRPNWAEGYLRLGLVHLGLYRRQAKEWLDDSDVEPKELARMAEPLWLLGALRDDPDLRAELPDGVDPLDLEPVRNHLVPAVRCFLEARRSCPFLALGHAELAALSELFHGENASIYCARALRLAGNDGTLIVYLAQVAIQTGDTKLAAQCWRKVLEVNPSSWPEVADVAASVIPADELLRDVVVDGRIAILFADRLYASTDKSNDRDLFLRTALERLPSDPTIAEADRLYYQAHAAAGLNLRDQACEMIESALTLNPEKWEWRADYVNWLLRWGRPDDAHRQALIGQYFSPESTDSHSAVDKTAEALARGSAERQDNDE
jgi:O-antigen ligase/tetratricopeptide (TPR) repeat protein